MIAREKFIKGQRVRLSALGRQAFPKKGAINGTVVGFGRDPLVVAVCSDGHKPTSRCAYHMDFWEPL